MEQRRGLLYGPGGLWVLARGGGGATNLRLTPKAVSVALRALRRQPARSPWIGGRTGRRHTNTKICVRRNRGEQTEEISPSSLYTNRRTRAYNTGHTNSEDVPVHTPHLSHTHTHTRLLSLSETQLIFWYRRGRPMCVHMDYCRLLPCLLTPLRSTQSLMLGDLVSIPVSPRLSCGHDNQIKMTATHSLMTR